MSQRPEDRVNNRHISSFPLRTRSAREKSDSLETIDKGTKSKVSNKEKEKESSSNDATTSETTLRTRRFPYVEVPAIKPSQSPSTAPSVNQGGDDSIGNASVPNRVDADAERTYKNCAPVEAGVDIEKLVESVLDLEISVPLRHLAGASGAIQKEIRRQMTRSRQLTEVGSAKSKEKSTDLKKNKRRVETLPVLTYIGTTGESSEIPEGYLVAADPVLQYLTENKDSDLSELIVATPSESLRAIYMVINHVGQEECLLDNGSMIVSMAKDTAIKMGLTWDPVVSINMESASNHVERTLGLARNVCFRVGGLDLYLQVHILENPPYKILLGRPFETLTSCVTKTKTDGSSDVVLTDPNTKKIAVIPTYKRGEGPAELQKQKHQGF